MNKQEKALYIASGAMLDAIKYYFYEGDDSEFEWEEFDSIMRNMRRARKKVEAALKELEAQNE
jgi:hypothetical protein